MLRRDPFRDDILYISVYLIYKLFNLYKHCNGETYSRPWNTWIVCYDEGRTRRCAGRYSIESM